jgi:hypothetical protein
MATEPKTAPKPDEKKTPEPDEKENKQNQDKPIEPGEPYPTGNPPDPEDQFFAAHGFRRAKE